MRIDILGRRNHYLGYYTKTNTDYMIYNAFTGALKSFSKLEEAITWLKSYEA